MAGRKPTVSDQEILAVFRETEDPVLTSGEIAEQISLSRRGVGNRLDKLHEDGQLERKQVGKPYVYFLPIRGINKNNINSPSDFEELDKEKQMDYLHEGIIGMNDYYKTLSDRGKQTVKTKIENGQEIFEEEDYPIQIVD